MDEAVTRALARVGSALRERPSVRWIIAYSGGKDSTAVLRLFCAAAAKLENFKAKIDVIYCDTGVENIAVDQFVKSTMASLDDDRELRELGFRFHVLQADVSNRFFVKIIGRGYPPPTSFFRWCTKELRIKPVEMFIREHLVHDAVVVLGTRENESPQRSRNIAKQANPIWQAQTEGKIRYPIFAPIVDFSVEDVWDTVFAIPTPSSINNHKLDKLYRGASGECPIIRAPSAPPCGSGRFGCWTCTVVRKDKSATKLVEAGYSELKPFLEFRDWLAEFRNRLDMRWPHRRNGVRSPGPFSLYAREIILARVLALETATGRNIINPEEMKEIEALWLADRELDSEARLAAE